MREVHLATCNRSVIKVHTVKIVPRSKCSTKKRIEVIVKRTNNLLHCLCKIFQKYETRLIDEFEFNTMCSLITILIKITK